MSGENTQGVILPALTRDLEEWAIMYCDELDRGEYDRVYAVFSTLRALNIALETVNFKPRLNGRELDYVIAWRQKPGWRVTRMIDLQRVAVNVP